MGIRKNTPEFKELLDKISHLKTTFWNKQSEIDNMSIPSINKCLAKTALSNGISFLQRSEDELRFSECSYCEDWILKIVQCQMDSANDEMKEANYHIQDGLKQ